MSFIKEGSYTIFGDYNIPSKNIDGKELHKIMKDMSIGEVIYLRGEEIRRTYGGWLWYFRESIDHKVAISVTFIPYSKEAVLA